MYVSDLVRVLRRRWYVAIPGLLITILAAGAVLRFYPPSLQATGSVVFVSPPVSTDESSPSGTSRSNPYLNFGSPLGATAEVVSSAVNSDQVAKELKAEGMTGSYQVGVDPNSSAPVVSVEATARTNAEAMAMMRAVVLKIRDRLAQIQADAGAPRNQYITAQSVTAAPKAVPVHGSLIRALALLAIFGVLASCGASVIVEGVSRGRERKRAESMPTVDTERTDDWVIEEDPDDRTQSSSDDEAAHARPLGAFPLNDAEPSRSPATTSRAASS